MLNDLLRARARECVDERNLDSGDKVVAVADKAVVRLLLDDEHEVLRLAVWLLVARTREANLRAALPAWVDLNLKHLVLGPAVQ